MSVTPSGPIAKLVQSSRVIVTVGAGGVGKTTTAAAIATAAAQRGRRVLCLTIDPAKRLAQALGLDMIGTEEAVVDKAHFARSGAVLEGSLTVMMLDTKTTFDALVRKYSSTKERADKLLANKLYKYVSTSLAGTQEYMAVEKLVAVKDDPRYDLVVLDTPPTSNALDFLDAPERLVSALDSATMKWFLQAFQTSGKMSLNLLAKSAAVVLKGMGKITGGGFLEAMAEFITELNDLFGGFKERARIVEKTLRSDDVAFVLVTSPAPMSIREVLYFAERLDESGMRAASIIVNRMRVPPAGKTPVTVEEAKAAIATAKLTLDDDAPARVARAHADAFKLAALDASHLRMLDARGANVPLVRIAERPSDVHDVTMLLSLGDLMMSGGE